LLYGSDSPAPAIASDQSESLFPVGREWVALLPLNFSVIDAQAYAERERGIVLCMEKRGLVYSPVTYSDDADSRWARDSNPLNLEIATQFGYAVPRFDDIRNTNPSGDAAFDEALQGSDGPDAGCARQSAARFSDQENQYFDQVNQLLYGLYEVTDGFQSSSDGLASLQSWSRCMADMGLSFQSPAGAAASFDTTDDRPSVDELRVRMADFDCDVEVGLTKERSQWEKIAVEAYLEDQALAIDEAKVAEAALLGVLASQAQAVPTFP